LLNTLRYAFRQRHGLNEECVLKHTSRSVSSVCLQIVSIRLICFNTLGFLVSQERFHRLGRPFVHVLSADWDLVSLNTFAISLH